MQRAQTQVCKRAQTQVCKRAQKSVLEVPRKNCKHPGLKQPALVYTQQMDAAVLGGQTAGGHSKAFPWPKKPLFAVPALRELESACRVSTL